MSEEIFYTAATDAPLIELSNRNVTLGTLINNDGYLHFEGKVTESAQMFFDELVSLNNTYMKELAAERDKLLDSVDWLEHGIAEWKAEYESMKVQRDQLQEESDGYREIAEGQRKTILNLIEEPEKVTGKVGSTAILVYIARLKAERDRYREALVAIAGTQTMDDADDCEFYVNTAVQALEDK